MNSILADGLSLTSMNDLL